MSDTPRPCIGPSSLPDKVMLLASSQCTDIVCRNIDFRLIRIQRFMSVVVDFESFEHRIVP
jgi:hypothetical protein